MVNVIEKLFEGMDFELFPVDLDRPLEISLQDDSLEEFKRFLTITDQKIVFYCIDSYDQDNYYLRFDHIFDDANTREDADSTLFQDVKQKIDRHNEQVARWDFSNAFELVLFCVYNGNKIGVTLDFGDIPDDILNCDDKYEEYVEEVRAIAENVAQKRRTELLENHQRKMDALEKATQEIEEYIRRDDSWKVCTNQAMRRKYSADLAKKWSKEKGVSIYNHTVFEILECCWSEYKTTNKL